MRWIKGRQGTGYYKMKLLPSLGFNFDCCLLKYEVGSYIPTHLDETLVDHCHHRFNLIVKSCVGGNFRILTREDNYRKGRFFGFNWVKFRPDIQKHSVSEVLSGSRYVLSVGWLTKDKKFI